MAHRSRCGNATEPSYRCFCRSPRQRLLRFPEATRTTIWCGLSRCGEPASLVLLNRFISPIIRVDEDVAPIALQLVAFTFVADVGNKDPARVTDRSPLL